MSQLAILTDTPQSGDIHTTLYGPSAPIGSHQVDSRSILLCGSSQTDPRATIQTLKDLGTTHLWLCESVGMLSPLLEIGDWVVADDYMDGTRGQHYTYFDDKAGGYVQQVPPFDVASRETLIQSGLSVTASGRIFKRGVYVCVSNTRLETPAEAVYWTRAGGHVVGRYLSPYLTLAREREMQVAVLAQVVRAGGQLGAAIGLSPYLEIVGQAWTRMA